MDAYEATRVVFSRIQALDPDNAAKIMGLLLLQDHGEKEMIRLAFGPESLLHSVLAKARADFGLAPPSPFLLSRQNSARLPPPPPSLNVASPSWAPPPAFARTGSNGGNDIHATDELVSPANPPPASPFHGGGDLVDELQLQDQLSFLNDGPKAGDLFYPEECLSPSANGEGGLFPYGMGWGVNGHHRRSCSAAAELCLGSDVAGAGLGWRPCLYFARGYCKNGSSCRFLHGLPDDPAAAAALAAGSGVDSLVEQQCQELLLRSKSARLGGASQLMASASFPYSPTGSLPLSPSGRGMGFLQSDSQRAAAAAAALMLGGDDPHKFGRARMERSDLAGLLNPGSRQIYLTFPAESTFREEDVSNYFSFYGPVQDVRIPYQQKRMFGFVTFVYPETVKLILAKGNPHFVCDARVLVKPYKEKGKVPDKFRKPQQLGERGDFSACSTPTGLDSRDPFELQHLAGARMLYGSSQEALLRRKLEEQQQQAELQQAIELQGRRFMGLQLLDLKNRSLSSPIAAIAPPITASAQDEAPPEDKSLRQASGATNGVSSAAAVAELNRSNPVNAGGGKEESGGEASPNEDRDFQESGPEHNLPDSPFASPTKASSFTGDSFSVDNLAAAAAAATASPRLIPSTLLSPSNPSFNSCFFPMPRFSDPGAIGM